MYSQLKTWLYDGGKDVHAAFALTGEHISDPITKVYGHEPTTEYTATQIAETNVAKRQYQKEYMEYWNSTASQTGTGRPVDAVITPLAPYAAARPGMYDYYGTCPCTD
jgi:amidase